MSARVFLEMPQSGIEKELLAVKAGAAVEGTDAKDPKPL